MLFLSGHKLDILLVGICFLLATGVAVLFYESFWDGSPFNSDQTFRELNDPYFNQEIERLQKIYTLPIFFLSVSIGTGIYFWLKQYNKSYYWHILFGLFCWPIIVLILSSPVFLILWFAGILPAVICIGYSLYRKEFGKNLIFSVWASFNNLASGVFLFFLFVDLFSGLLGD